jgi:sorbitol/mannitol transport system permease protein
VVKLIAQRIEASAHDHDDSITTLREKRGRTISQLLRNVGRVVIITVAILLTQIPLVATLYYSFQEWNLLRPGQGGFVGFANYTRVLSDGSFLSSLGNTVVVTGSAVVGATMLGLLFAVLLDRKFPGQGVARTLMITPFLVMPAAAALIWKWSILDFTTGMANWGLSLVGLPPVAWNTQLPAATVIMVLIWQFTPFVVLDHPGLTFQDSIGTDTYTKHRAN